MYNILPPSRGPHRRGAAAAFYYVVGVPERNTHLCACVPACTTRQRQRVLTRLRFNLVAHFWYFFWVRDGGWVRANVIVLVYTHTV